MVQGEGPGAVDCRYVLYDPAQDTYYRLPTTMEQSEAAVAATGESGALYAGLYGFALDRAAARRGAGALLCLPQ